MTINLVQHMGPEQAHQLLEQSFAQYQTDRSVVRIGARHRPGQADGRRDRHRAGRGRGADPGIRADTRADSEMERAQSRASRLHRRAGGQRGAGPDCAAATSSRSPTAGTAGWRWCWSRPATAMIPGPLVLTEHRWAGRIRPPNYSGCCGAGRNDAVPKRVEHRHRGCGAIWPRRCGRPPPGWAVSSGPSARRSRRRLPRSGAGVVAGRVTSAPRTQQPRRRVPDP